MIPTALREMVNAIHVKNAEALSLDESRCLREKDYLQTALGVTAEVYSAGEPGADRRARLLI